MNRRKANEAHRQLPVRDSAPSIVGYALLLVACQLTEWGGLGLSERTSLALVPILQYWTVPLLVAMGAMLLAAAALWSLVPVPNGWLAGHGGSGGDAA